MDHCRSWLTTISAKGETSWSGRRLRSLQLPPGYSTVRCCLACCSRCRWPRCSSRTIARKGWVDFGGSEREPLSNVTKGSRTSDLPMQRLHILFLKVSGRRKLLKHSSTLRGHFSAAFRSFAQVAARLLHAHPISKAEPTTCRSIQSATYRDAHHSY